MHVIYVYFSLLWANGLACANKGLYIYWIPTPGLIARTMYQIFFSRLRRVHGVYV